VTSERAENPGVRAFCLLNRLPRSLDTGSGVRADELACRPDLDQEASTGPSSPDALQEEPAMSVYRVTEVIGTSSESWEAAARSAVETAAATVRELRVAEVLRQDVTIENGQITGYRVRLAISFKYDSGS